MKRRWQCAIVALGLGSVCMPSLASAQDSELIITPVIPLDYDRDRNVSVTERPRPDYDPLGIRTGGFLVYPRLQVGGGYSSNVYLSEIKSTGAAFGQATGSVRATSDWSRNQLSASLSGTTERYAGESRANENSWQGDVLGRADLGNAFSLTGEAQAGKNYETPFTSGTDLTNVALSSYDYSRLSARGQYSLSRTRFILGYTRDNFSFNSVKFPDGTRLDQSDRDRTVNSIAGQAEYALSPTISGYAQLSYSNTAYDQKLEPGVDNRDSDGYRILGGVNFDLPAFLRGTIAAGYTFRNYHSPMFKDVSGPSVEAQVEYFYSELTTVTFNLRRVIEDSSLADTSAFFDNRVQLRVDHELLENLILGAAAEYAYQDYIGIDRHSDIYRGTLSARYLVSHSVNLGGQVSYGRRTRGGVDYNGTLNEFRALATVTFQR